MEKCLLLSFPTSIAPFDILPFYLQQARVHIKLIDMDNPPNEDDDVDEHVIDLDGLDLDGTGHKWAYPHSESVESHEWIERTNDGESYSTTNSV